MEFSRVKIFVAVAQKKSFSKAADMLFISQPTVTSNVQKLESELGIKLFNRKNKNISLTEGGMLFYRYALELVNIYSKAEHALSIYKKGIEGVMEIYASTIPEQYLLPYIVKGFKEKYPLVHFSIRHKDSKKVLDKILSGTINFGFVGARHHSDALEYIDFYDDRLVLITSPKKKFPLDAVGIESLEGEDILLREEGSGTRILFENALKKKKLDMSIFGSHTINDSLETIKKMVALDVGIGLVSEISVKREVASGQLKKYEIKDLELERKFSLVYCKNRCLSPIEERFRDFVLNWRWNGVDA
ncbi:selenium metabolism-associated LysR family transcriptional regulator [Herbivorax sp. ANBcel31]|uniref:selenium metabolism-associated LysR family transcriptional regulator n=1 Tax=Herbivorax sp. ANBcel31 TaxID=3069754 RepID=UPI0027B6D5E7|nr:selenium metabolism-associated LysR family transcriptional regulator [Herbivorax sp. ANBcel31]MDQ2087243.1 selenium metabolism-associated LysR family transcriptional regulator [Herbivorax sp. ANBcel31]